MRWRRRDERFLGRTGYGACFDCVRPAIVVRRLPLLRRIDAAICNASLHATMAGPFLFANEVRTSAIDTSLPELFLPTGQRAKGTDRPIADVSCIRRSVRRPVAVVEDLLSALASGKGMRSEVGGCFAVGRRYEIVEQVVGQNLSVSTKRVHRCERATPSPAGRPSLRSYQCDLCRRRQG